MKELQKKEFNEKLEKIRSNKKSIRKSSVKKYVKYKNLKEVYDIVKEGNEEKIKKLRKNSP